MTTNSNQIATQDFNFNTENQNIIPEVKASKKLGRHKKDESKKYSKQCIMRLTPSQYEKFYREYEEDGKHISISDFMRGIIMGRDNSMNDEKPLDQ